MQNSQVPLATYQGKVIDGNQWIPPPGNEVTHQYYQSQTTTAAQQEEVIKANTVSITFIDTQVGKLLDVLDSTPGGLTSVLVVLSADHGFHLGDHGFWGKHTNLEQGTRVPLIIAPPPQLSLETINSPWRAQFFAGRVERTPVELLDIIPTILDLTGVFPSNLSSLIYNFTWNGQEYETPESATGVRVPAVVGITINDNVRLAGIAQLQGVSLRNLLLGQDPIYSRFAVSQYTRPGVRGYAFRSQRYRYVQWFSASGLLQNLKPLAEELYDYQVDPYESRNLVSLNPSIRSKFQIFWQSFLQSGNVYFLRSSFPEDETSNEDASMVNYNLTIDVNLSSATQILPTLPRLTAIESLKYPQIVDKIWNVDSSFDSQDIEMAIFLTTNMLVYAANITCQILYINVSLSNSSATVFQIYLGNLQQAETLSTLMNENREFLSFTFNNYLSGLGYNNGNSISSQALFKEMNSTVAVSTPVPTFQPSCSPSALSKTISPTLGKTASPVMRATENPSLKPTPMPTLLSQATLTPSKKIQQSHSPTVRMTLIETKNITIETTSAPALQQAENTASLSGGIVAGVTVASIIAVGLILGSVVYFIRKTPEKNKLKEPVNDSAKGVRDNQAQFDFV